MTQLGGGRLGGVPLAPGTITQNFLNLPKGPINCIYLDIAIAGAQVAGGAGGFALVVNQNDAATAEGVDDCDILLSAIFDRWTLYWEQDSICGTMTPPQWRTILGLLNQRDFGVDGVVPAGNVATTIRVRVPFPVSLDKYFADGSVFTQGSSRISAGQLDYGVTAIVIASVALANGNFAVTGVTVTLDAEMGIGDMGDCGPTWRVNRYLNLPTNYDFPVSQGGRIALLDTVRVAASTITAITVGDYALMTPRFFQGRYRADRLYSGGYDITARCTPFIFLEQRQRFMDFLNICNRSIHMDAIGPANMSVYEVVAIPPSATAVERVATNIGGGGATSQSRPSPASLPVGSSIPTELSHIAPVRVRPVTSGEGRRVGNPASAGNVVDARKTAASTAAARKGFFRR